MYRKFGPWKWILKRNFWDYNLNELWRDFIGIIGWSFQYSRIDNLKKKGWRIKIAKKNLNIKLESVIEVKPFLWFQVAFYTMLSATKTWSNPRSFYYGSFWAFRERMPLKRPPLIFIFPTQSPSFSCQFISSNAHYIYVCIPPYLQ